MGEKIDNIGEQNSPQTMNLKEYLTHKVFDVVSDIITEHGLEAYVIGGYVRDILLCRKSKDIDIVVVGSGIELATLVHKAFKGSRLSVFKSFGTAMVKLRDIEVEFVGARRESYQRDSRKPIVEDGTLEDDQNRRDFTINALAIDLRKESYGELVDPFGGLYDLDDLIIRTPLEPGITFSDDPLRMMRAIRFASQLGFNIEEETFDGIVSMASRIEIISKERITDELNKIMLSPMPSIGIKLLEKSGLLPYILPEVQALKGIDKVGNHGHKDNFYHSLQVLDTVSKKSDNLWLRWAALLHDIGKPKTKKYDKRLGWTFHNHNYIGMKMVSGVFRRLKLPLGGELKYVEKLVDLHMRPIVLSEDEVTDSAVRRLLFEAGDDVEDLMILCESDITSKIEEKVQRFLRNFKIVRRKMKEIEEKDHIRNFQPPVSGEEIMEMFNLKPSPMVGVLKNALKDAVLDGVIHNDYAEAVEFLKELAKEHGMQQAKEYEQKS